METEKKRSAAVSVLLGVLAFFFTIACVVLLFWIAGTVASAGAGAGQDKLSADPAPGYERYVNNLTSAAMEGLIVIPKEYWLAEDVTVAPKPDQDNFGSSDDPADAAAALSAAAGLLNGDETIWSQDRELMPGSTVRWYLDDTIFSISWKEVYNNSVYSFAEVKVAHPSQFRRYLADNTFASPIQYPPSDLAETVNAVTALSADFYKFRGYGIVIYQRKLYRAEGNYLDSCFVDGSGDLHLIKRGTLTTQETIQNYIDENDILFSLSFGPILIEDGEAAIPGYYPVGEIDQYFPRCALCQLGDCHYLLVTAGAEGAYTNQQTLRQTANVLLGLGVRTAYTLDGGQTATMIMNNEIVNRVLYGYQRNVSDIIYFATAIPEKEGDGG